jgi:phosphotransferase system HPr-like phosphotransfer protein
MLEVEVEIGHDFDYSMAYKIFGLNKNSSRTNITIKQASTLVNGKDLFQLLTLCAKNGTRCTVVIDGHEEHLTLEKLMSILDGTLVSPRFNVIKPLQQKRT